jgi:hypothetical protein
MSRAAEAAGGTGSSDQLVELLAEMVRHALALAENELPSERSQLNDSDPPEQVSGRSDEQ